MSDREFEELVKELQADSARHPGLYRIRVMLLAAMGYAFLVGSFVGLSLFTIGFVYLLLKSHTAAIALKLLAPLGALMFIMMRALWVKIDDPEGMELTSDRVPDLFELIVSVRDEVSGPTIHQVLLNSEFNAGIMQVPRLGVFGWQKNFLVLGLPYLQALTPAEFRAVVAHEMGHLVGAHGRSGIWIYRQGKAWNQLQQQLETEKKAASAFFSSFLRWYMPMYNAYTFVMRRAHEYDADRLSAAVSGSRVAADMLTRTAVVGRWVSLEFWTDVWGRTRSTPEPPRDVMAELGRRARVPSDPARVEEAITAVLAEETSAMDTHPSLKERLGALGEDARIPAPFEVSAADELLGPELTSLQDRLGLIWSSQVTSRWQELNAAAVTQQKRLLELEAMGADTPMTTELRWERACLLSQEDRTQEVEQLVEGIVADAPHFAQAKAAWGMILLKREDEGGFACIDQALDLGGFDPEACCREAFGYLTSRGRPEEAARYRKRFLDYQQALEAARKERSAFVVGDAIEPHGLEESHLTAWREVLARFPDILSARIAQKRLAHFPESPMLVLAIEIRISFWKHTLLGVKKEKAEAVRKVLFDTVPIDTAWACVLLDLLSREERVAFEEAVGPTFYVR